MTNSPQIGLFQQFTLAAVLSLNRGKIIVVDESARTRCTRWEGESYFYLYKYLSKP